MSLLTRILLAATAMAVLTACGVKPPLSGSPGEPGGSGNPPIDLPVVGGAKVAPVSFGPEGPKVPSLYRAPDGTWGIAYGSDKLGNKHVYFSSSKDGSSWSPAAAVNLGNLSDQDPALFADAGGFHVLFASNREVPTWALYASDLGPGGWSGAQRLNLPGGMPSEPSVCRTPHGWALAYRSTDGLVVAESADGRNWYEARVAATHLGDPAIAQIGERLTVVAHRSAQLFEISRGPDGVWTPAKPLGFEGQSRQPALGVDPAGRPTLAFAQRTDEPDGPVQISLSTRAGGRWTPPETLIGGSGDHLYPTLHVLPDGGRALAWGIYRSAGERGIVFAPLAASPGMGTAFAPGGHPHPSGGSRY